MTFPVKILVSIFLATLIYCLAWRIVLACFRIKVYRLVNYMLWIQIHKYVSHFNVKYEGATCKISSFDLNNAPITIDYPIGHIVNVVINHKYLFDWQEIGDKLYKGTPNEYFVQVADITKFDMIKISKKLHERFDEYPKIIKAFLKGAHDTLNELDKELAN